MSIQKLSQADYFAHAAADSTMMAGWWAALRGALTVDQGDAVLAQWSAYVDGFEKGSGFFTYLDSRWKPQAMSLVSAAYWPTSYADALNKAKRVEWSQFSDLPGPMVVWAMQREMIAQLSEAKAWWSRRVSDLVIEQQKLAVAAQQETAKQVEQTAAVVENLSQATAAISADVDTLAGATQQVAEVVKVVASYVDMPADVKSQVDTTIDNVVATLQSIREARAVAYQEITGAVLKAREIQAAAQVTQQKLADVQKQLDAGVLPPLDESSADAGLSTGQKLAIGAVVAVVAAKVLL